MGLDINAVRFLIAAHRQGVNFDEVLTIGRQDLNVYPAKMAEVFRANGLPHESFLKSTGELLYAEPCFRALGAKSVSSMDVSNFEGATFVHDLNQPIPSELKERFDIVYDGGTLEHVFDFAVALKNCMEMVRPGGRLFMHTCANNYCGHGFYQFSPELFYTAFSQENGFEVEWLVLHRVGPYGRWFEVSDPRQIRSRVELITYYPLQLLVRAKRTAVKSVFSRTPQQSDYTVRWEDPNQPGGKAAPFKPSRPRLATRFPNIARLLHVIKMGVALYRNQSLLNRNYFRPISKSLDSK
jgi:SAM-dependent methyltransferase